MFSKNDRGHVYDKFRNRIMFPIADRRGRTIAFVGAKGGADHVTGDAEQIPWAHLDIAGPSFNEGSEYGFTPKQGTGVAVRTLVTLAERIAGA